MKKNLSEEEIAINEKKKEYLRQFRESVRAVRRIEEQIKELEANEMCPSAISLNGMPIASSYNNKDLSVYIAKKDELLSHMIRARHKRIVLYHDIFKRIEDLQDEDEKEVLTLRYIKGMKWEAVACHRHVEWAQVHRIHARALKNFKLPDDDTL